MFFVTTAGALSYLLINQVEKQSNPLDLLSAETLAVMEWSNPVGSLSRFQKSRLGRNLQEVDWWLVAEEFGISDYEFQRLKKQVMAFEQKLDSPLADELFGREVVVALMEPGDKNQEEETGTIADFLVVIVRPRHRAALLDYVGSLLAGKSQTLVGKYQGIAIRKSIIAGKDEHSAIHNLDKKKEEGLSIFTATANGLLLASFSLPPLKQCLDRVHRDLSGLSTKESYADLRARNKADDQVFSYLDLAEFSRQLKAKKLNISSQLRRQLQELETRMAAHGKLQTLALSGSSSSGLREYTTILQYVVPEVKAAEESIYRRLPEDNVTLAMVPADQLFYFWTNYFGLYKWLSNFADSPYDFVGWIDKTLVSYTGYNIAGLAPLFGSQFGFSIADVNADHYVPLPMMCFFFQTKEREKVERVMQHMLAGIPLKHDMFNSVPVTSIQAAGGLLQPSYTYIKDFLIVADSRSQIESIIENNQADKLVNDALFQRVDNGLHEKNNIISFIRTEELIGVLQKFASWAGSMLTIEDQDDADKVKNMLDRVIAPILDGLKMYQVKSGRIYNTGSELRIETKLIVDDA